MSEELKKCPFCGLDNLYDSDRYIYCQIRLDRFLLLRRTNNEPR